MQDANSRFYIENIECGEKVNFDKECVTVIDGAIYTITEDGVLRMDCFYDEQISGKKTSNNLDSWRWIYRGAYHQEMPVLRKDFFIWSKKGIFLPVLTTALLRSDHFLRSLKNASAQLDI